MAAHPFLADALQIWNSLPGDIALALSSFPDIIFTILFSLCCDTLAHVVTSVLILVGWISRRFLLSSSSSGQNVERHRISQPDILLTYVLEYNNIRA